MMELQLGLAPPNHLIKGFDLNSPEEIMGPVKWACVCGLCGGKRDFDEAFDGPIKTLPLLWKEDDGGDEDDDGAHMGLDDAHSINQCNKRSIVGWPPIKAIRKLGYGGGFTQREEMDESKGGYVKVMMEGVAIGRKVDLTVHDSYQTLTHTLNNMFGICEKSGKEDGAKSPRYKLAYQDKEGDWMLVGDVPWGILTWFLGMGFILDDPDYLCVGSTMDFQEFVNASRVIAAIEDPDSRWVK